MEKISLSRLTKENSHAAHCILCHDGGGNLYACYRGTCKRIYHIECYDPANPREPDDYWKCLLCKKKEEFEDMTNETDKYGNMGERDFYVCFRLMLEIKSSWPMSRTFEPSETLDSDQYRAFIHYPIAMDVIQQRLNRSKGDNKYTNCTQFMQEVRRMFSNCRTFWTINTSHSYSAGMYMRHADKLEEFFNQKLQVWEKLFSTYIDPADRPKPIIKETNPDEPKPEPYVPSFMLVDSPERPARNQKSTYTKRLYDELHPLRDHKVEKTPPKASKCFVCQKPGKEDDDLSKCSKCKKGYHANCYVPALKRAPPQDWNCIMCVNVEDLGEQPNEPNKEGGKLGKQDYLICSRLFLELHKVWPDVKTFLSMEALDFSMYRNVINHPVALDLIRKKLDRKSPLQYESVKEFLKDARLMFRNCKIFWKDQAAGENFLRHADTLKEHLDKCLQEFQPILQLKPEKSEKKKKSREEERSKKKESRRRDDSEEEHTSRSTRLRGRIKREKESEGEEDEEEEEKSSRKPGPRFSKKKDKKKSKAKEETDESDSEEDRPKKKDKKKSKIKQETDESDSEDDRPKKKDKKKSKVKQETEESDSEEDKPRKKDKKKAKAKKEKEESDSDEDVPRKKEKKKSKIKQEKDESDSEEDMPKKKDKKKSKIKQEKQESDSEDDIPLSKLSISQSNSSKRSKDRNIKKEKFSPVASRIREKQKDSEIQRDTQAEEAFETGTDKNLGKNYECNYCNAVYNKLSTMEEHTLNHFEEKLSSLLPSSKPHKCPTCSELSDSFDSLMKHYAFDCESVNETQECIRKNLSKKNPNEWEL